MKRLIVLLLLAMCTILGGCGVDWGTVLSISGDVLELRADREAAGKDHIEDVFKEESRQ